MQPLVPFPKQFTPLNRAYRSGSELQGPWPNKGLSSEFPGARGSGRASSAGEYPVRANGTEKAAQRCFCAWCLLFPIPLSKQKGGKESDSYKYTVPSTGSVYSQTPTRHLRILSPPPAKIPETHCMGWKMKALWQSAPVGHGHDMWRPRSPDFQGLCLPKGLAEQGDRCRSPFPLVSRAEPLCRGFLRKRQCSVSC